VTLPGGYSIQAFEYQMKAFDAPWHFHKMNELTYIVSSRGLRYVGNQVAPFEAGDFVLLGGNVPHCWKNSDKNEAIAHAIVIQWEDGLFSAFPEFDPVNDLLERSRRGIQFDSSAFSDLEQKLFSIIYSGPLNRYILFISLLNELCETDNFHYICDINFNSEFNIKTNQRLEKIFNFIKSNYHQKISLSEVSELSNMTEQSFSRFFSKTLKKSFFTYLNEYRINMACKQLLESDLPVSEIAYLSGFGSMAFFHRQFRKHQKLSPMHYKKLFSKSVV
jgi:AraC-like DNA-binding protein